MILSLLTEVATASSIKEIILVQEEKRRFKRIGLHTPIRFQIRGEAVCEHGITENISEGGLAFSALQFIPASTPLMLEVNVLEKVLRPIARVSWCQPMAHSDRQRLGVEFVEFDSADRSFLSEYINLRVQDTI